MRWHVGLLAAALALPGIALAQQPAERPAQPAPQAAPEQQAQQDAAREQEAKQAVNQMVEKLRQGKDNYRLQGTIEQVAPDQSAILVSRAGDMPGVVLVLPPNVGITADGKQVGIDQLQAGDQIRATFNIAQQYPIALDIVRTGKAAPPAKPGK